MIDFDPSRHVYKKWVKMRNKMHFITFCVWYILLYFVFCHILCILFNFKLQAKLLNFIFIEVMWKLNYLRWLNFVQEKWLRRHFFMSPCNFFFFFFRMRWPTFPHKMWVTGRGVLQDHKNMVSRASSIFMTNKKLLKSKND